MEKLGFIGMGNMASAIARGFINSGKISKENLFAFAPNQKKLKENATKIGFTPEDCAKSLVQKCDTIIIACKPYQVEQVLLELKNELKDKTIISIAAGWILKSFQNILGENVRIQCIMPNTPAMVGEGVLLFERENSLTHDEHIQIKELFLLLGIVEEIDSNLMGIAGAISGCGPAFFDLIIESYADAAVKYGISRDKAYRLVSQTMLGSAKLQQITGEHPGVLKDAVCSPNGTTIRGVASLEKSGIRDACISSIDAIMNKA